MRPRYSTIFSGFGTALLFTVCPACQHRVKRAPIFSEPGDTVVVPITGNLISSDLKGLWGSECWVATDGPERLHVTFERAQVTVDRSKDTQHAACAKNDLTSNDLHIKFRFKWTSGTWVPERPFFRSARIELIQVLARSDSDSLTAKFNETLQCGFGQWKTNKDHDITNANCQGMDNGVRFSWPLAAPVSMDSFFKIENNQLTLMSATESADQSLLSIFSAPGPIGVSRFDVRDISVKYWNNEKPDIDSFVFSQTIPLDSLPLMEGNGGFREKHRSDSNYGHYSIKNGVMSFQIKLYNILQGPFLTMEATSFQDKVSGDRILLESSESGDAIVFTKGSTVLGKVDAPALPKRGSSFDLQAPVLEFQGAPDRIVANEPFELKIHAPDDLSGLDSVSIKAQCTGGTEIIPMKSIRYEGQGKYSAKFVVTKTRDKECTKIVTILVYDRVGHEARVDLDLPVQLQP